jgi:membrane protease YdiL (CAAX protease family)
MSIGSLVTRYPLVAFFTIAYATSFIGGYLSEIYPSDWWALFVYGPFIGGFIITAIAGGGRGLKAWFGRIGRWRVGLRWYAVILLLPVGLQLIALGLNRLLGGALAPDPQLPALVPEFMMWLLFIGLAEEPGFRGFALPRLLAGRSALSASLILGVLHTIWHLPLFVSGSESPLIIAVILSGAVFFTWIFLHTRGSVFIAMLYHAAVNTVQVYFMALLAGPAATQQLTLLAIVYVATALLLVALTGPTLTRRPALLAQPVAGPELS